MPSRVPTASTEGSIGRDQCQERKFLDCDPKILDYWMGKEGLGCYDLAEDFILVR